MNIGVTGAKHGHTEDKFFFQPYGKSKDAMHFKHYSPNAAQGAAHEKYNAAQGAASAEAKKHVNQRQIQSSPLEKERDIVQTEATRDVKMWCFKTGGPRNRPG